jgi:small subunit ribosomal protein S17
MEQRPNSRKVFIGKVVSDKMNKTRVIQIRWLAKNPDYDKTQRKAVKFKAHDEKNESKTGVMVKIMKTRPLSKEKRGVIIEIIKPNQGTYHDYDENYFNGGR